MSRNNETFEDNVDEMHEGVFPTKWYDRALQEFTAHKRNAVKELMNQRLQDIQSVE